MTFARYVSHRTSRRSRACSPCPKEGTRATESESFDELKRMEKLGVIVRYEEPTEWVWVNSLVVQKPTGAVRLCIDPRDLNLAIKRPHYPMKTINEVASRLQGANIFSILDAASGFWQLK